VRFSLVDVAASLMKVSKEEFVQAGEGPEAVHHREIVGCWMLSPVKIFNGWLGILAKGIFG